MGTTVQITMAVVHHRDPLTIMAPVEDLVVRIIIIDLIVVVSSNLIKVAVKLRKVEIRVRLLGVGDVAITMAGEVADMGIVVAMISRYLMIQSIGSNSIVGDKMSMKEEVILRIRMLVSIRFIREQVEEAEVLEGLLVVVFEVVIKARKLVGVAMETMSSKIVVVHTIKAEAAEEAAEQEDKARKIIKWLDKELKVKAKVKDRDKARVVSTFTEQPTLKPPATKMHEELTLIKGDFQDIMIFHSDK